MFLESYAFIQKYFLSIFEQTTEQRAGATVFEMFTSRKRAENRHETANYAISYLITNGDKCHEEVQGTLTANNPGIWHNPDRRGKLSQGSDIPAETGRTRRGVGDGWQVEGGSKKKDRETEGRRKNLLKGLRRRET